MFTLQASLRATLLCSRLCSVSVLSKCAKSTSKDATKFVSDTKEPGDFASKLLTGMKLGPGKKRTFQRKLDSPECTKHFKMLIANQRYSELEQELRKSDDKSGYPSRDVLRVVSSIFAKEGNIDGIRLIQSIAKTAYPIESTWMLEYQHYLAEAYWKQGQFSIAIQLFNDIFNKTTHQRKKVIDMLSFMMRDIFVKNISDQYQSLFKLAEHCIKLGYHVPAASFWRWSFLSTDIEAHHLANDVLELYPELEQHLPQRINTIIAVAYEKWDIDVLHRLVQLMLTHSMSKFYPKVLGALLNIQCDANDLRGAKRTIEYCLEMKIELDASSIRNLLFLYNAHKQQIPEKLLHYTHASIPTTPELNW